MERLYHVPDFRQIEICQLKLTMTKYVALLRGINVGGNNLIKMSDLKSWFEEIGFTDVSTYINSGNVFFSSKEKDNLKLTKKIENKIKKSFRKSLPVVVKSEEQIEEAITKAPKFFGKEPNKYKYDVLFLKDPLTPKEAIKEVSVREGVDEAIEGKEVLYFSRTIKNITKSHLNKIVMKPIYKNITIRNWNTSTKLLKLLKGERV